MAKRLSSREVWDLRCEHDLRIKERYPWDEWCDGNWWLIERDVDYTVTDKTFSNTVYRMKPHLGRIELHQIYGFGYLLKSLDNGETNES